jgi:AhpD family alkylhydroperoxidase
MPIASDIADVTVTNRRADTSANEDLTKLARHGADTFGYKADLRIDRKLAQLLRLRVSQINNCAYCLNLHYEAARDAGIPRPVIDTLTAWWRPSSTTTRPALLSAIPRRSLASPTRPAPPTSVHATTRSPSTSRRRRSSRSSGSSST